MPRQHSWASYWQVGNAEQAFRVNGTLRRKQQEGHALKFLPERQETAHRITIVRNMTKKERLSIA